MVRFYDWSMESGEILFKWAGGRSPSKFEGLHIPVSNEILKYRCKLLLYISAYFQWQFENAYGGTDARTVPNVC
jgi:hypothetical protein